MKKSSPRTMRLPALVNAAGGVLGLSVAIVSAITLISPASAASAVGAWGPDGRVVTDSSTTVRWDNTGNEASNVVARDASQVLPLTGGKTYADVRQQIRTAYGASFADGGFADLSVTVSQTRNLVNQGVSVEVSGMPGYNGSTRVKESTLDMFQCWGAPLADGTPDPNATAPDPRTCQSYGRQLGNADSLAKFGDLAGLNAMPFLPVGTAPASLVPSGQGTYFNLTTTNEKSILKDQLASLSANGTVNTVFETQTTTEANHLGCGYSAVSTSSNACWLVMVPERQQTVTTYALFSPMTPSLWAQRMQVKLSFDDIAPSCANGSARSLAAGSELATRAMATWIPAICDSRGVAAGYSQLSDGQARSQLATGGLAVAVTSRPATASADAVYAPLASSGVVVGTNIARLGESTETPFESKFLIENGGKYSSKEEWEATQAMNGLPVTLNLNARLVVKLLTLSYQQEGIALSDYFKNAPYLSTSGRLMTTDADFLSLNPTLKHQTLLPRRLEVEGLSSDSAAALWSWIVNDPAANRFLNGCPDAAGMVISPWYSTRSYVGCEDQATTLEAAAKALRDSTISPAGFNRDTPPSYPPTNAAYPQPLFVASGAWGKPGEVGYQGPSTLVDIYPPYADQAATAQTALRGQVKRGGWCDGNVGGCNPGQWKATAQPSIATAVITDTVNAARYKLQTANLCNAAGSSCVGATADSIRTAVAGFVDSGTPGALVPPVKPDYAGGAYPLAMVSYAAVRPTTLSVTAAASIAQIIDYATTTGQVPGLSSGQLAPGYAPLTTAQQEQAQQVVTTLRTGATPTPTSTPTPTPTPTPTSSATKPAVVTPSTKSPSATPTPTSTPTPTPKPTHKPTASPSPAQTTAPAVVPQAVIPTSSAEPTTAAGEVVVAAAPPAMTPATAVSFPQFGLGGGLAAALASAIAAPIIGRRKKVLPE